jgi:TPP-dependent pyruvate/acetoin dehydrogenase alpha subunit
MWCLFLVTLHFLYRHCTFFSSYTFHTFQVDAESYKELEHWNEMLKNDAIKFCQENNFNSGFFEGSDSNTVVDAYELKVREFIYYAELLKSIHS